MDAITPSEALSFASQIGMKHFEVSIKVKAHVLSFDEDEAKAIPIKMKSWKNLLRIDEIELSVRSTNCLSGANIETIAELVSIPERQNAGIPKFR